jgi:hypothetical protein
MSATRRTVHNYMRRNNLGRSLIELHFAVFRQLIDPLDLP